MANGYSTGMTGAVITTPTVIPQNVTNAIRVNENTPNLQMIQSFPVVSRDGNIHIHQDPTTGQLYEMTDEFHAMIPQIVAQNSNSIGGVIIGGGMTGGSMPVAGISTISTTSGTKEPEDLGIIYVTELTKNLSEIIRYDIFSETSTFIYYKDPSDPILYRVSRSLKDKSNEILASRNSGLNNIPSIKSTLDDLFKGGTISTPSQIMGSRIQSQINIQSPNVQPIQNMNVYDRQQINQVKINRQQVIFVYPRSSASITTNPSSQMTTGGGVFLSNNSVKFTYPSNN